MPVHVTWHGPVLELALDRPARRNAVDHETLVALADAQGWPCTTPRAAERRGGTVALDVPHGYEVSKVLKERDIVCDYRPAAGVRQLAAARALSTEM